METTADTVEEIIAMEEKEMSPKVLQDAFAILITEKLQDHLDKQELIKEHPEFKKQEDTIALFNIENAKEIQQIQFINQPEVISDSITKIITKVHFNNAEIDTIVSYIKTATTIIDGVKFKTSKASFKRLQPKKKID